MKEPKDISDFGEKVASRLQSVKILINASNGIFDKETSYSIDERVKRLNKESAEKSIKEYKSLLHILEEEGIPLSNIPTGIRKIIGLNYYRLEKWQEAVDELLVYVQAEHKDADALLILSLCQINLKTPQNALKYLKTIIAIDSQNAIAFNYWGVALKHIYNKTKDVDCLRQAVEKYQKAAEIKSSYYDAIHNKATALEDLHIETKELVYLNQSIEKYEEAIKIKPDFSQPHFNYSSALIFLFHAKQEPTILDEALMHGKKVIELDPEDKNIHYNIACAYSLKKNKIEMLKSLKIVFEFDSKYKTMARDDNDFENFMNDPDFIAITEENA